MAINLEQLSETQLAFRLAFLVLLQSDFNPSAFKQFYKACRAISADASDKALILAREKAREKNQDPNKVQVGSDEIAAQITPLLNTAIANIEISYTTAARLEELGDAFFDYDKKAGCIDGGHVLADLQAHYPASVAAEADQDDNIEQPEVLAENIEPLVLPTRTIQIDAVRLMQRGHTTQANAAENIATNIREEAKKPENERNLETLNTACSDEMSSSQLDQHRGVKQRVYNALILFSVVGLFYRAGVAALTDKTFWITTRPQTQKDIDAARQALVPAQA